MEKDSVRMHKKLYRLIGDELPVNNPEFNRFMQAIPLSPRDKADNNKSAEDLLAIWEKRGGIDLGHYKQLRDLLGDTEQIQVLAIANRQIVQIENQLTIENKTTTSLSEMKPDPFKDDPSCDDPTKISAMRQFGSELLGKRKRSDSPPQQQYVVNQDISMPQSTNPPTSQSSSTSRETSFSTAEPYERVPQMTRSSTIHLDYIQCELRDWYINILSRLHPIPWCEWREVDLDHVFTNLEIIPGIKDQLCPSYIHSLNETMSIDSSVTENPFSPDNRLNSDDGIQTLSRVFNKDSTKRSVCLIEGPMGIGKSTFCRRLAYLWSKNSYNIVDHSFDVLFLLEAKLLTSNVKKCINQQLFPKDFVLSEENIYECLRNRQKKCLLIIDGIDELTNEGKTTVTELLKGERLRHANLLLTGRPEASREFIKYVNSHLKIKGFSFQNVREYICKYLGPNDNKVRDMLLNRLERDVQLKTLTTNPFTALLVCILVKENKENIPTNLIDIINLVLHTCCQNYVTMKEGSGKTVLSEEKLLSAAGHLAYNGIKEYITAYPEETLTSLCPEGFSEHLLKSGILSKAFTVSRLDTKCFSYFPHKPFQEFLCAKYLAELDDGELKEKLEEIFGKHINHYYHMDINWFGFLLGILKFQLKTKVALKNFCQTLDRMHPEERFHALGDLIDKLYESDTKKYLLELLAQTLSTYNLILGNICVVKIIAHNNRGGYYPDTSLVMRWAYRDTFDPHRTRLETPILFTFLHGCFRKMKLPPAVVVAPYIPPAMLSALSHVYKPTATKAGNDRYIHSSGSSGLAFLAGGPFTLRGTELLGTSWPCIQCFSMKDANDILTKGIKVSILTIFLTPGMDSSEDTTALIKCLTPTRKKVAVLFVVLEDLHEDQHFLRMLSFFSSLQHLSFIKITRIYNRWSAIAWRKHVYSSPGYMHSKWVSGSITQMYYSKCCPY